MKLDIPFFSQLDKNVPVEIQRFVCAIACLKMVLDSKLIKNDFLDLYKEAEFIDRREINGWNHEVIVRMLRNHGVLSYRQEFLGNTVNFNTSCVEPSKHSAEFVLKGITKIKQQIKNNQPVIASVFAGFSQDGEARKSLNMTSHIVLITGFDDTFLYINDPIFDVQKKVSTEHFLRYWRRLTIFIE